MILNIALGLVFFLSPLLMFLWYLRLEEETQNTESADSLIFPLEI